MATPKTGRPEGRPPIQFDLEGITALASLNCTMQEIAHFFGVSESTVDHRFLAEPALRAAWDKGRASGKLSLRRKQTELANAGNVTMLIWLGKQLLGQKDQQVTEHAGGIQFNGSGTSELASRIASIAARSREGSSDSESDG